MRTILIASLLFAGLLTAQEHPGQSVGAVEGGKTFLANCASCHGPNGDLIAGVDLMRGKIRRAATDGELIGIIQNGIPVTGMPPSTLSREEATNIVAYLRERAAEAALRAGPEVVARGKALFNGKGGCMSCHRVLGNGARTGPDLTGIGLLRNARELEQSVLEPAAEVRAENQMFHAVTKAGATVTGRVLNEDTFTLQVLDSTEHLRMMNKADLREFSYTAGSPMPPFQGKFSALELSDLVNYLLSLKGAN